MAKKKCHICGKTGCNIALDGKSGYCKTQKQKWEVREVPLDQLKPGPIQHQSVSDFYLDIMRWTHKIIGHYIQPTLEQWELGFMRDMHMDGEIAFWHRAAFAFIEYHKRKGIGLRSENEEQQLIGEFVSGCQTDALAKQCLSNPAGWQEEVQRVQEMGKESAKRWTPPVGLENWPNPPSTPTDQVEGT